jgi:hypothetical protein
MIEQYLDIIRMEHQDKIKSLMEQLYAKDDIIKSLQEQKST